MTGDVMSRWRAGRHDRLIGDRHDVMTPYFAMSRCFIAIIAMHRRRRFHDAGESVGDAGVTRRRIAGASPHYRWRRHGHYIAMIAMTAHRLFYFMTSYFPP
jgi:hypothetical protein